MATAFPSPFGTKCLQNYKKIVTQPNSEPQFLKNSSYARGESNPNRRNRNPIFYPLNYGRVYELGCKVTNYFLNWETLQPNAKRYYFLPFFFCCSRRAACWRRCASSRRAMKPDFFLPFLLAALRAISARTSSSFTTARNA